MILYLYIILTLKGAQVTCTDIIPLQHRPKGHYNATTSGVEHNCQFDSTTLVSSLIVLLYTLKTKNESYPLHLRLHGDLSEKNANTQICQKTPNNYKLLEKSYLEDGASYKTLPLTILHISFLQLPNLDGIPNNWWMLRCAVALSVLSIVQNHTFSFYASRPVCLFPPATVYRYFDASSVTSFDSRVSIISHTTHIIISLNINVRGCVFVVVCASDVNTEKQIKE